MFRFIVKDVAELNEHQQQAVVAKDGPVLIMAGPGTGKTKTLAARVAYVVDSGRTKPGRILALTFTVKAAREMRERVAALLGGTEAPTISTFHALGYEILRSALPNVPLSFAPEADRIAIIRGLPRPKPLVGLSVRELSLEISKYKGSVCPVDTSVAGLVQRYDAALAQHGWIDFDDLQARTHRLLAEDQQLRATWQAKFDAILIDEFQDTSQLQWAIIQLLRGNENLFVIGDPKQSIYGFRGAGGQMFDQFRQDFPNRHEVSLGVNYRSARAIVAVASALFGGRDALTPHSDEPGVVRAVQTLNEYSEADLVLDTIERGIGGSDLLKAGTGQGGRRFRDFAVLYRTHRAALAVTHRLRDSGIPYQVVGEGSPYEQPDVRAVIDSLRWLNSGGELPAVKDVHEAQVRALLEAIDAAQPVSRLADTVARTLNLAKTGEAKARIAQFVGTLVRFDSPPDGLATTLRHLNSIEQADFYDPKADAVTLLTIHAAKGLEFEHVLLIATEEGILPHVRKTAQTDFAEERRLFYVAVTRARTQLDILYAKRRGNEARDVSRFVAGLPEAILPREIDQNLAQLEKKLHKRQQKARQATLF